MKRILLLLAIIAIIMASYGLGIGWGIILQHRANMQEKQAILPNDTEHLWRDLYALSKTDNRVTANFYDAELERLCDPQNKK